MARRVTIDRSKRIELAVVCVAGAGLLGMAWLWRQGAPLWVYYGYIAASAMAGAALYIGLRDLDQPLRRRMLLMLLGVSLFAAAAFRDVHAALFQIEGFFFDLFDGILFAAVLHYLIAKIVGPFVFGRIWCGWACWTAALLDQLPFKRSPGRLAARWGYLRYLHFAVSCCVVAALWFGIAYRPGAGVVPALTWFLAGNALYLLIGVVLALALKDNRAFCKYVCPIPVFQKVGTRFALLKIDGDSSRCCRRQVCEKVCPMDIQIADYLARGERISSTECVLCQACISVCPEQALTLSFAVDGGGPELLRQRATDGAPDDTQAGQSPIGS